MDGFDGDGGGGVGVRVGVGVGVGVGVFRADRCPIRQLAPSGGTASGWAGVVDGAVGKADRQLSVGAEREIPSGVVHLGVVMGTDWEQVGEIGLAAVPPPRDVMELAAVVPHPASGDGTPAVERSQCSPLGWIREPGGVAQVELAGGVEHDAVAHDHRVDVTVSGHVGQDPVGNLDRQPEIDRRPSGAVGLGRVDDHHVLVCGRRADRARAVAQDSTSGQDELEPSRVDSCC